MKIQEKFDLKDRVAIVTGGAGLLGAEFCKTLAEAGACVAVADLNIEAAKKVADALTKEGYPGLRDLAWTSLNLIPLKNLSRRFSPTLDGSTFS